jgi:His/Glu/Gln/Arg/opine family amino acid ABC transporter permease subunit
MTFSFDVLQTYWPLLVQGTWLTIRIVVSAFILGYSLGIITALISLIPNRVAQGFVATYTLVFRSIPFIVILFFCYYGLPFAGIRVPAYVTGTLALSLFVSAYYCEIIRAAIIALPKGQFESARVIGMSPLQAIRHVILPQVIPAVIPPSTNMTLTMTKESAVLSSITVGELTYQSLIIQGNTFAPFEAFAATTAIYWLMTALMAAGAKRLEKRVGSWRDDNLTRSKIAASFLSFERVRA